MTIEHRQGTLTVESLDSGEHEAIKQIIVVQPLAGQPKDTVNNQSCKIPKKISMSTGERPMLRVSIEHATFM